MPEVFIGLGANLGDAKANITFGRDALAGLDRYTPRGVSSLYITAPVGPQDQPAFLNAVARGIFEGTAHELLEAILAVEHQLGRIREERWGPRVLDMDLLLYGRQIIDASDLKVPHPEMPNRAFVLEPLAELASEMVLPLWEKTPAQLLATMPLEERKQQEVEMTTWE